jgi:type II secretory pathway component PulJ
VTNGATGVTRPRAAAGFTLVELLIAFAVAALVLAGATSAFQVATKILEFGVDQAAAQETARWALERMAREIRGAGYGHPTCPPAPPATSLTYCFDAVGDPTATSITLQNDFNANELLDAPVGACDPAAVTEQVRYRFLVPVGELRRSTDPDNPDCDTVVASGVANLSLVYLDANGNPLANPAASPSNIRSVVVTIHVASENGATEQTVVMRDQVRVRNR